MIERTSAKAFSMLMLGVSCRPILKQNCCVPPTINVMRQYFYFCINHPLHVVPVPQYFLLCISHRIYPIQYGWLDFQEYPKMAPGHAFTNRFFLVCFGYLVWMGILFLHTMALGGTAKTRLCRSFKFIHSVPGT